MCGFCLHSPIICRELYGIGFELRKISYFFFFFFIPVQGVVLGRHGEEIDSPAKARAMSMCGFCLHSPIICRELYGIGFD
jgi:hypothetical protein